MTASKESCGRLEPVPSGRYLTLTFVPTSGFRTARGPVAPSSYLPEQVNAPVSNVGSLTMLFLPYVVLSSVPADCSQFESVQNVETSFESIRMTVSLLCLRATMP